MSLAWKCFKTRSKQLSVAQKIRTLITVLGTVITVPGTVITVLGSENVLGWLPPLWNNLRDLWVLGKVQDDSATDLGPWIIDFIPVTVTVSAERL